ncbi:hypothetical protein [Cupriavidus pampae]|nr:hypothetical protein [Cupriavidus pampae]
MFYCFHAGARARTTGLISLVLAASLLSACGSDDTQSPPATQTPPAQTPTSRLVVDTGTAAPAQGGTMMLKATLLGADGQEVKGAKFAWSSSNEAVATVVSASDLAPAAAASVTQPVGIYATVRLLAPGEANVIATATLPDGSQAASTTHLAVQPAAAKTYSLTLSPSTLTVNAGAAPQVVTAVVQRSDGVDGAADLKDWSWAIDNNTFAVTPASDSHSAQVSTTGTLAATGQLTACASTPAGDRLCSNAALTRALVPLPSIAFSASSLSVRPGLTGTVSVTLTDAQGANLAGQVTLAWSIQQSGTAASIVSVGNGGSVTIGMDAAQVTAYTATLTVTATYPDGRSNSSTLPLSSPGVWTRLPDAPIASPSIISLAIDGTRVWRLTADGSQPARLERFGAADDTAVEPGSALPATAQGIWLAAAANPANSAVMVQLGADGSSVSFGSFDGDLAGARADTSLRGCGPTPTGRNFVTTTGGNIDSTGWCPNMVSWTTSWWERVGGMMQPTGEFSDAPVLDARPFPDGSGAMTLHNDGVNEIIQSNGMTMAYVYTATSTLSFGAVAANAADQNAQVYGYASSLGIVSRPSPGAHYANVWSAVPSLIKLSAIPHFLVGLSASSWTLFNTDTRATTTIALPAAGTPTDFVSALDANGKVRIAAKLVDGSVWLYQQP